MYLPPILTSSRHSDPGTDGFKYLNVRESGPSLSEGFYTAAQEVPLKEDDDSVPPPIPERDDSDDQIYECIEGEKRKFFCGSFVVRHDLVYLRSLYSMRLKQLLTLVK